MIFLGGNPQQAPVDPYFYSVTSLLHGDGTNGGQNNTFLDSSSNNFTITRNGNTTQGSFSPFSQTGWSNYFNGSSTVSAAYNSAFQPNTYVSLECWVYFNSLASDQLIIGREGMWLNYSYTAIGATASKISFGIYNTSATWVAANSTTTPALNQWYHIVGIRDNTTLRIYINGVQEGTATFSGTPNTHTSAFAIGGSFTNTSNITGYVSNARYCNGATSNTLPYTGTSFTVPTSPLTVSTNTILLTCQSNRFVDNSGNAYAITANGSPSVQPFSPFNPITAYSTSTVGGSGYFDGSGDYLSVPSNAAFAYGTGALTIEAFINTTTKVDFQSIIGSFDSVGWFLHTTATGVVLAGLNSGTFITGTKNVCDGAWHHVAMVRSGSTLTLYIDGVSDGAISDSTNVSSTTEVRIGGLSAGIPRPLTGYISSLRVVKGTAVYTANFTPPTAPLTAIANTSLLTNFTNGAIFDNAAVADYETVGNAQISTSVKKYGTGSLAFDGTGDRLFVGASSPNLSLRGSDYTVEMWVYPNSYSGFPYLISSGAGGTAWAMYLDTGGALGWGGNTGANQFTAGNVPLSTWTHVAVSQSANVAKWYINGNLVLTKTATDINNANWVATNQISVGSNFGANDFNGYIDDLRISKGVGRYPYNFTPPTAEFPNIGGSITLTADPYYEYTTLLLPGNGTNGAQNNTFLDSSTNAFSITRNGNTTQGTFSPFSQTGWGNYFDGSGDYLTVGSNAALGMGTGDFTVELWFYYTATPSNEFLFDFRYAGGSLLAAASGTFGVDVYVGAGNRSGGTVAANNWYHLAVTRSGSTCYVFLNGTQVGATFSDSTNLATGGVSIASRFNVPTQVFPGYISNFRVVKGTAVYTSNFTPSTTPLTAITNTSLLTCQSNRFIDNSTNNFTITRNGDVSVQAFSPFNPTAAWSAATNGGSGYFDGSGDYLNTASNAAFALGSGSFTIEMWVYSGANGTSTRLGGNGAGGSFTTNRWIIATSTAANPNKFTLAAFNTSPVDLLVSTSTFNNSQWMHVAIARSGNAWAMWVNGAREAYVASNSAALDGGSSEVFNLGRSNLSGDADWAGYVSGFKMVKGTAVYDPDSTTITIPTAPPANTTNTSLLLNYTNAGIYDATSKNDLETVGNAQISTTQSKSGGSSMLFDGNGDDLKIITNPPLSFSGFAGDFTIEAWVYPTATGQSNGSYLCAQTTSGSYAPIVILQSSGTYNFVIYMSSTGSSWNLASAASCGTATANAWNHIAVTRYGTNVYCFMNGILQSTTAVSTTAFMTTSANWHIGSADLVANSYLTGYINDLRITKGIARYTSNFTAPTTAFPLL